MAFPIEFYSTEEQFQAACTQWFWNELISERRMLHHNNNNSHSRNKGALMAAVGVVDGVSDLELVYNGGVAFIELKLENGVQSNAQKDFQQKVEERGHEYVIIRPPLSNFQHYVLNKLI